MRHDLPIDIIVFGVPRVPKFRAMEKIKRRIEKPIPLSERLPIVLVGISFDFVYTGNLLTNANRASRVFFDEEPGVSSRRIFSGHAFMADMDHDANIQPNPVSPVALTEDATPRKRKARREIHQQDDQPHFATARSIPERLEKALALVARCAEIADDNRAKDILLLDLRQATPLIDFFLIATASTRRLSNAIAIEIDVEMKKNHEAKLGMEGTEEGSWILIDYGDFVIHLFTPESRTYYSLEEIWGDAPRLDWKVPSLTPLTPTQKPAESN